MIRGAGDVGETRGSTRTRGHFAIRPTIRYHHDVHPGGQRGRSSMVEPLPSKQITRVRFPSPAPNAVRPGIPTESGGRAFAIVRGHSGERSAHRCTHAAPMPRWQRTGDGSRSRSHPATARRASAASSGSACCLHRSPRIPDPTTRAAHPAKRSKVAVPRGSLPTMWETNACVIGRPTWSRAAGVGRVSSFPTAPLGAAAECRPRTRIDPGAVHAPPLWAMGRPSECPGSSGSG